MGRNGLPVKPSATPSMVRIHHLPPHETPAQGRLCAPDSFLGYAARCQRKRPDAVGYARDRFPPDVSLADCRHPACRSAVSKGQCANSGTGSRGSGPAGLSLRGDGVGAERAADLAVAAYPRCEHHPRHRCTQQRRPLCTRPRHPPAVTTDRKIICWKWARGSGPGPGAVIGPGQGVWVMRPW